MDQFLTVQLARAAVVATSRLITAQSNLDLEPTGSTLEQSVPVIESRVMAVSPGRPTLSRPRPMASLPDEDVASVQVHGYTNGLRQDIMLRSSARRDVKNSITILVQTSRQPTLDEQVPMFKPTEAGIRSEIGGQFPNLSMQVVERPSSNAYGPYGLAIGREGADVRCAYMWQWIDANRLSADAGVTGPVSVRIRLCKAATTFDAMAAEIEHLTISGAVSTERVASNEPVQLIAAPSPAGAPLRVHRKPSRRLAAHKRRVAVAQQNATDPAPVSPTTGPRYMSPTLVGAPAPAIAVVAPPTPIQQLSGDLPAEAYRGPATKTSTKYY